MQYRQRTRRLHHKVHIKRQRVRRITYFTQSHMEGQVQLPKAAPSRSNS